MHAVGVKVPEAVIANMDGEWDEVRELIDGKDLPSAFILVFLDGELMGRVQVAQPGRTGWVVLMDARSKPHLREGQVRIFRRRPHSQLQREYNEAIQLLELARPHLEHDHESEAVRFAVHSFLERVRPMPCLS